MPPKKKKNTSARFATTAPTAVKPCACTYELVSVRVKNREIFADHATATNHPNHAEWLAAGGGVKTACIHMRTNLSLIVNIRWTGKGAKPAEDVKLSFKMRSATITSDATPIGDDIAFDIDTGVEVAHGIGVNNIQINTFKLATVSGKALVLDTKIIRLEILTVFGNSISDNVKETTLLAPGSVAGADEVVRLQPFFSIDHVRNACKWASGASRLNTQLDGDDVVETVIVGFPQIEYGEDPRYFDGNDGWNLWDNTGNRTGDCSQQASFFADVLGTLGVRAHDFELKCEYRHTDGNLYRRYFGNKNPDDWPCHGVVLVRYAANDYRCYDTSFHDPRISRTLTDSLVVSSTAPFLKPQWQTWCHIPDADPNNVQGVPAKMGTTLTKAYPESTWKAAMKTAADTRFPQAEIQQDPGA